MTLGQKQRLFSRLIAELILWAYEEGYQVSLGDAYRDPRVHGEMGEKRGYGHPWSNHKRRLAVDLNLFDDIDGDGDEDFLQDTESHRALGLKWESMHPLCRWGGRFGDGNHYSFEHGGRM